MTELIVFQQDSMRCMNGCEIKGIFEAKGKEEHTLGSRFFKGVAQNLQNNEYLQKLPGVDQPKKKKKSNKKQQAPEAARGREKKQEPQASRGAVDNTRTRRRTDLSSSFSNFSDIEVVKETFSSVARRSSSKSNSDGNEAGKSSSDSPAVPVQRGGGKPLGFSTFSPHEKEHINPDKNGDNKSSDEEKEENQQKRDKKEGKSGCHNEGKYKKIGTKTMKTMTIATFMMVQMKMTM